MKPQTHDIVVTDFDHPRAVASLQNHDDYLRSAPTPEHFIPLLYIAGLAGAANRPLEVLVEEVRHLRGLVHRKIRIEPRVQVGAAAKQIAACAAEVKAELIVMGKHAPLWNVHVRHGTPYSVVRRMVDRSETDLLVLGTQGFSGAAYVFLGSIAGELLRAAKCDVLVVPPTSTRA